MISVHDVGEQGAVHYLAMDLLQGESLEQRVRREGPLEPAFATRLARDVARALQHAHERGVLHRDLKPANILLVEDGRPVVVDFGLAKDLHGGEALTMSGELLGTPAYMPPEQMGQAHRADQTADVYSLGATLYFLLTGGPPFQGTNAVNLMFRITSEPVVAPSRVRPGVPASLDVVCLRCLAKAPAERYPDMASLIQALDAALTATPPARSRIRPLAVTAVGLAVVAIVGGARSTRPSAPSTTHEPPASVASSTRDVVAVVEAPTTPPLEPLPGLEWVNRTGEGESSPGLRFRIERAAAFDRQANVILLFGGTDGDERPLGDLWAWDGKRWSPHDGQERGPPARWGHAVAYDAERRRLVMFGGSVGDDRAPLGDLWTWNGSTWKRERPAGDAPAARMFHAMAWDPVRRVVLLFGGRDERKKLSAELWAWDGARWERLITASCPPARWHGALAMDERRGTLVLFGGSLDGAVLNDVWEWDGRAWLERPLGSPWPPGVKRATFVYGLGRTILFGGVNVDEVSSDESWAWDGARWERLPSCAPARNGHAMAWDPQRGVGLVVGGFAAKHVVPGEWELRPVR